MADKQKRPPMVAAQGFAIYHNGVPRHIRRGDVVGGDDPILKTHAAMFREVDSLVEKTTAWPGERRAVRFPERVTAQEASAGVGTPHHRTIKTMPEEAMGHQYPPEHENSAASPEAPFQPSAGVVADDVPDEQMVDPKSVRSKDFTPPGDPATSPAVSTANVDDAKEDAEKGKSGKQSADK